MIFYFLSLIPAKAMNSSLHQNTFISATSSICGDLPGSPSVPLSEIYNVPTSKPIPPRPVSDLQKWSRKLPNSWRAGVSTGATIAMVVLLINISMTVWGSRRLDTLDGIGTIYQGSCTKSKSLTLWIHLVINILGTLLLGASNYAMQCLSSPTREDVDKAHAKQTWLEHRHSWCSQYWKTEWTGVGLVVMPWMQFRFATSNVSLLSISSIG